MGSVHAASFALAVHGEREDPAAHAEGMRAAEAILFASAEPVASEAIAKRLPRSVRVDAVLADLERLYAGRGVNLVRLGGKWAFRTASDLAFVLAEETGAERQKLSRAAMEVLAIIAYHQPTTRAEIEEIRGVTTSKGTLDALLETRWIRMRGRRKAPGRPVTYGTTPEFLHHFGLNSVTDLPGLEELQGLGLLEGRLAADVNVPLPSDDALLTEQEEPLDPDLLAFGPRASDSD